MGARMNERPLFTLVVPVYGVERWIPSFLDSLAAQTGGLSDTELIFVIDGSPDDSEGVIRRWMHAEQIDATVFVKENGGLSSARNAGLGIATGTWVSYPDPDDVLDPGYLQGLRDYLATADPDYIVARFMPFLGDPTTARDDHPLSFRFARGTRTVDIDQEHRQIPFSVNNSFAKVDHLREIALEFDGRVRPVAEDGVYTASYLSTLERRHVGFIAESMYLYRKREDGSSLVDRSWMDIDRYLAIPRWGFRHVIDTYFAGRTAPRWLQNMAIYDLQWYYKNDLRSGSPTASLNDEQRRSFNALVDELLARLESAMLLAYNITSIPMEIRLTWLARATGSIPAQPISYDVVDGRRRLGRVRYLTDDPDAHELIELDGRPEAPFAAKTRSIEFFGQASIYERIVWVDAMRELQVTRSNSSAPEPVTFGGYVQPVSAVTPNHVWWRHKNRGAPFVRRPMPVGAAGKQRPTLVGRAKWVYGKYEPRVFARVARMPWVKRRYANAWALIDRDTMARDNAESLYRYLQANRPDINAWFVIRKDAPDFARLKADGFKLVPAGTRQHVLLMKHARQLISSQIDHYIVHPYDLKRYGRGPWSYTFLQHGVTKDDLSHWLNNKAIDLILAANAREAASFSADGTPYKLTTREVALTGFPRHDELQAKSERAPKDLLLVVPTWRQYLLELVHGRTNERRALEGFRESEYFTSWMGFLGSDRLRTAAEAAGLTIAFAPHPNLQDHLTAEDVPAWVKMISYSEVDIKDMLARARYTVTDYSSLAFDSAYTNAPVFYFQFDREQFFAGAHAYRKGYFNYDTDGFGPVAFTGEELLEAVEGALETNGESLAPYRAAIEGAFEFRDTGASARTVAAIEAIS
ncbi:bifunctional glycosyltransferase/CDP-glycerol:glycerophosphate glycerophosphotransferase [Agromyces sp. Marseille-Q5079]|uniref:bifunctional glycosyltransferase/CDP-glycerol:glycerophosphate glycerophosphotransferase n=1 Tax=Agromyces sp. Marseille-Q5079 TaxID=3439059 RepID=UPI003D9C8E47